MYGLSDAASAERLPQYFASENESNGATRLDVAGLSGATIHVIGDEAFGLVFTDGPYAYFVNDARTGASAERLDALEKVAVTWHRRVSGK